MQRLKVIFDPSNPRRDKDNCFTVPSGYTLREVADGAAVKLFAECLRGKGVKRKRDQVAQPAAPTQPPATAAAVGVAMGTKQPSPQAVSAEPSPAKKKQKKAKNSKGKTPPGQKQTAAASPQAGSAAAPKLSKRAKRAAAAAAAASPAGKGQEKFASPAAIGVPAAGEGAKKSKKQKQPQEHVPQGNVIVVESVVAALNVAVQQQQGVKTKGTDSTGAPTPDLAPPGTISNGGGDAAAAEGPPAETKSKKKRKKRKKNKKKTDQKSSTDSEMEGPVKSDDKEGAVPAEHDGEAEAKAEAKDKAEVEPESKKGKVTAGAVEVEAAPPKEDVGVIAALAGGTQAASHVPPTQSEDAASSDGEEEEGAAAATAAAAPGLKLKLSLDPKAAFKQPRTTLEQEEKEEEDASAAALAATAEGEQEEKAEEKSRMSTPSVPPSAESATDSESESSTSSESESSESEESSKEDDSSAGQEKTDATGAEAPATQMLTQPSGRFDGSDEGLLSQLLRSAARKGEGATANAEELEAAAREEREAAEAAAGGTQRGEEYQWQKGVECYKTSALVRLCRVMVREAINADRAAKGEKELSATQIYKNAENTPDWWPLGKFAASAFEKKDEAMKVYNAARKVLAAVHGVNLADAAQKAE